MAYKLYDMYDNKLHLITGIPEETPEKMVEALSTINPLLDFFMLICSVRDAFYEMLEWSPKSQNINGNHLLTELHKAERLTRAFLFEFRTTLDHMETKIKHDYGKDSEEWKLFKDGTGKEYDDVSEYAFTYHLRNCAQHCSNVVHGFNGLTGSCISSNKDELLRSFSSWNKVDKDFLSNCDANIDLLNVFSKAFKAFNAGVAPLIQHFLDKEVVLNSLWYLRKWGDCLCEKFHHEINDYCLLEFVHSDGSPVSESEIGDSDIELRGISVPWEVIFELTNSLCDETGRKYYQVNSSVY